MFTAGDLELVGAMAHNASLAVANARLVRRLRAAEERLKKENAFLKGREETRRTGGRGGEREILGRSAAMRSVTKQIDKVVDTKVTVLVEGETGVGKELVAAAIHYRSRRRDKLFIGQNCAAVPEKPARERAVRSQAGLLHRRARGQEGALRAGRRRHLVPRRGRRRCR